MSWKLVGFSTTLAMSVACSALAQAGPVAQVSKDQLVCQLSGDCAKVDDSLDTQDKPESRGFSIARRTAAPAQTAASPTQTATHYVAPRDHAEASAAHYSHVAAAHRLAPSGPVGHADLSINFVSGSAELTDGGKQVAQTFMQALNTPQLTGKRFMIGGHTDAVGSRALNIDLSRRRAQALVDFLVAQGASRAQFDIKGYGFDQPLPGTSPQAPANRRVEVVTLN